MYVVFVHCSFKCSFFVLYVVHTEGCSVVDYYVVKGLSFLFWSIFVLYVSRTFIGICILTLRKKISSDCCKNFLSLWTGILSLPLLFFCLVFSVYQISLIFFFQGSLDLTFYSIDEVVMRLGNWLLGAVLEWCISFQPTSCPGRSGSWVRSMCLLKLVSETNHQFEERRSEV